jgi:hypothetical protein
MPFTDLHGLSPPPDGKAKSQGRQKKADDIPDEPIAVPPLLLQPSAPTCMCSQYKGMPLKNEVPRYFASARRPKFPNNSLS